MICFRCCTLHGRCIIIKIDLNICFMKAKAPNDMRNLYLVQTFTARFYTCWAFRLDCTTFIWNLYKIKIFHIVHYLHVNCRFKRFWRLSKQGKNFFALAPHQKHFWLEAIKLSHKLLNLNNPFSGLLHTRLTLYNIWFWALKDSVFFNVLWWICFYFNRNKGELFLTKLARASSVSSLLIKAFSDVTVTVCRPWPKFIQSL